MSSPHYDRFNFKVADKTTQSVNDALQFFGLDQFDTADFIAEFGVLRESNNFSTARFDLRMDMIWGMYSIFPDVVWDPAFTVDADIRTYLTSKAYGFNVSDENLDMAAMHSHRWEVLAAKVLASHGRPATGVDMFEHTINHGMLFLRQMITPLELWGTFEKAAEVLNEAMTERCETYRLRRDELAGPQVVFSTDIADVLNLAFTQICAQIGASQLPFGEINFIVDLPATAALPRQFDTKTAALVKHINNDLRIAKGFKR